MPEGRIYTKIKDGLTACGGDLSNVVLNCITFSFGQWTPSHQLLQKRYYHTSGTIDNQVYLIGGYHMSKTTEIITVGSSSTTDGFALNNNTWYVTYLSSSTSKINFDLGLPKN